MTEAEIQHQLVYWLKQKGIVFHAGLEGAKRHPAEQMRLKRAGMQSGFPDLTLFLRDQKTVFIELKTKNGSVSANQKLLHDRLRDVGFDVHVIRAATGGGAIDAVKDILELHRRSLPAPEDRSYA